MANAPQPGQLTAGEWRDLEHWPFWLELMGDEAFSKMQSYWSFYPTERLSVEVVNGGQKVPDADVTLTDAQGNVRWQTKTDLQGRAHLFVRLFDEAKGPYDLTVNAAGTTATLRDVRPGGEEPTTVELDTQVTNPNTLDLMFVIDTTGSMGDELEYLKVELQSVIERLERASTQTLNLRLSVNFYRDEGDEYVLRAFPFSEDVPSVLKQLAQQALKRGRRLPRGRRCRLRRRHRQPPVSAQARARLLFLVLDAPPPP